MAPGAAQPRPAATVILIQGTRDGFELLMVRRNPEARFMAGHWVFPGGAVDPRDGTGQAGLRAAAARELREEAGIKLDQGGELVAYARWITPERAPIRFDTWFYLARAPHGQQPSVDGAEVVAARWLTPGRALELHASGTLELAFPTRKQLEQLAAYASAEQLIAHARERADDIRPLMPVITARGEIVLPQQAADGSV
ncbi:MAG: NUDIX hydrolase [Actinomycetota bacterium]|nr:NUDIX hydrolase [Actinomycetota bacterium]